MAKEESGVDEYSSMKGLIRLRSLGHEADVRDDEDEEDGGGSDFRWRRQRIERVDAAVVGEFGG